MNKISVITVAYNSGETIRSTLISVRDQSFTDIEYIVIDGGSADSTLNILSEFPSVVSKLISEPDYGIYDAMNKGLKMASGDVIGILNSDDFYLNDKVLQDVSDLFTHNPEVDVLLGGVDFVHNQDLGKPVRSYPSIGFRPWMLRFGIMPPHPAMFVRKAVYDRFGPYKQGYNIAADFDFMLRSLLLGKTKYLAVSDCWVRMRVGGASTNGWRAWLISTQEMKRAMRENGLMPFSLMLMLRLPFKFLTQVFTR